MRKKMIALLFVIFLITFFYANNNCNFKNSTLKDQGARNNLLIGAAVDADLLENDLKYSNIIASEYSIITPENEMKFSVLQPSLDDYDFKKADYIVDFALNNNIKIRGHTLVWDKRIPGWVEDGDFSKEDTEFILKNHINTVMQRYKGKIYAWDVVNEAFNKDGSLKDSIWLRTIGPDYIKKAFIWAREADPDALLFYNDYTAEIINDKSNAIFEMVNVFKKEEIPIDGIGFQFHTSLHQKYTIRDLVNNFKRFEDTGLDVNITELDVKLSDTVASEKEKFQKQAEQYSVVLESCLEIKSCNVFGMWGVSDKYTWLEDDAPLIFDKEFEKKPSYKLLFKKLSYPLSKYESN